MRTLLIFLLCFSFTSLKSQERSIKVYNQFLAYTYYSPRPLLAERQALKYNGTSIAFRSVHEKRLRQISLKPVYLKVDQGPARYTYKGGDVKLDVAKEFENYHEKFDIFWGGSTWLGFLQEQIDYSTITSFPVERSQIRISFSLFASVEYHFTRSLYVEFAANFFSGAIGWTYQYTDNPNVLERQRTQSGFDMDLFSQRNFQIGLGYLFGVDENKK